MGDREEGPLSRWSRLKREAAGAKNTKNIGAGENTPLPVTAAAGAPARPASARAIAAPQTASTVATQPAEREPNPVRIEDLPTVDTLTYESDFTVFLREGIPAVLRSAALARLWRSDPILANLDGLNDYEDDYRLITDAASPLRKLFEPESPAEMALEREQRLPRRDRREPAPEQAPREKVDAAKAAPEQEVASGGSESESDKA